MNDVSSKYVGLDVHKETIALSIADAGGGEVRYYGEIKNTPEALKSSATKSNRKKAGCSFAMRRVPVDLAFTAN